MLLSVFVFPRSAQKNENLLGSRSTMLRFLPLTLIALALAGCGAPAGARYLAARERWQARPVGHYLLRTFEDVRGQRCAQAVEVRDESLVRVISNSCQHPNLWTVSWLFNHVANAQQGYAACALLDPSGCVCRYATEVEAAYDAALGYPREIVTRQTWQPDWRSMGYWRHAIASGGMPSCAPPVADPGWVVVVRELRPLP
jgi:hypothetical protein